VRNRIVKSAATRSATVEQQIEALINGNDTVLNMLVKDIVILELET